MNTKILQSWLAVATVFACASFAARAQSYSVRPFAIATGGGASAGGAYRIVGTIGQHQASGQLTGGVPAAPSLNLAFTDANKTNVIVSWTSIGGNYTVNGGFSPMGVIPFVLQQKVSDLTAGNWTPVSQPLTTNGINRSIIAPFFTTSNIFYRLKGP